MKASVKQVLCWVSTFDCTTHFNNKKNSEKFWVFFYARGVQGVLPMRVGGATSQLDLPSLTPLSVAGCGRLQLGVPHWATSVITAIS